MISPLVERQLSGGLRSWECAVSDAASKSMHVRLKVEVVHELVGKLDQNISLSQLWGGRKSGYKNNFGIRTSFLGIHGLCRAK